MTSTTFPKVPMLKLYGPPGPYEGYGAPAKIVTSPEGAQPSTHALPGDTQSTNPLPTIPAPTKPLDHSGDLPVTPPSGPSENFQQEARNKAAALHLEEQRKYDGQVATEIGLEHTRALHYIQADPVGKMILAGLVDIADYAALQTGNPLLTSLGQLIGKFSTVDLLDQISVPPSFQ